MTNMIDGEGNRTAWSNDTLGRIVKTTYANGSAYEYDARSRPRCPVLIRK